MAAPYLTGYRMALQVATCLVRRQRPRLTVTAAAASHSCSGTGPQRSRETSGASGTHEDREGPEYIPKRKARNPMTKIGYAWMIGLPTGIIGFMLAKRQVDKNRLKQLKIRQRMKKSNAGAYEGSRYQHPTQEAQVER